MMLRRLLIAFAIMTLGIALAAQEGSDSPAASSPSPEPEGIEPIFPSRNEGFVMVEGEDAVSTNFAPEPILSYGVSGSRTLQLNKASQQGSIPYFADFAFYLPASGEYELWIGGTPPGPRDEAYPSYVSPVTIRFGDEPEKVLYREDVEVASNYSPSYYWMRAGSFVLPEGEGSLRFSVPEKRRHDGRFFFYLDAFFLIRVEGGRRVAIDSMPPIIPADLEDRSIDYPFRAVEDYLILLRDSPNNKLALINLSRVYSLLGDYLSAIKHLKRVLQIEPGNEEALLLHAKNLIWKGDVKEGLAEYGRLIERYQRKEYYLEAGKVAAWSGDYSQSQLFFGMGLARYPGDLDLLINLGLTMLWASQEVQAKERFAEAERGADKDPASLVKLAGIFAVNGYPDFAIPLLEKAIALEPARLESYFALEELLARNGREDEAYALIAKARASLKPSPELEALLSSAERKIGLRGALIARYKEALERDPDDLGLRELLAQSYFWNGKQAEAMAEYLNILASMAYKAQVDFDRANSQVYKILGLAFADKARLSLLPGRISEARDGLRKALADYQTAAKAKDAELATRRKAEEAGKEYVPDPAKDPMGNFERARYALADAIARANALAASAEADSETRAEARTSLAALVEADRDEAAAYAAFYRGGWWFDKASFVAEMLQVSSGGLWLGDYLLARHYEFEGNADLAAKTRAAYEARPDLPGDVRLNLAIASLERGAPHEALVRLDPPFDEATQGGLADALRTRIEGLDRAPEAPTAIPGDDDTSRAENALAALASLERAIPLWSRELEADITNARILLREKSVRLRYRSESETMPIRVQLASYYVKAKELDLAARQLRAVLRIDPSNVSARYLLGSVYRWQGRWAEAQDAFYAVYLADPGFEQAVAFYNGIALDKAASASSSVSFSMDTGRSSWSFTSGYSAHLGQGMKLDAGLDASFAHARDASWGEASWGIQRLKLSIEFEMGDARLSPFAGVAITGDAIAGMVDPLGFTTGFRDYGKTRAFAGMDFNIKLGETSRLTGSYSYSPWQESLSPYGATTMAHDGELTLSLDPGSISFLDFLGMRLYGRNAYIEDGADILTALANIDIFMYRGGNPYSAFSVGAQALWQDSVMVPRLGSATRYWRPEQVLSIEGSATYGIWGSKGFGLSAQLKAGSYLDKALSSSPDQLLKLGAYLGLEYSSELARVALVADFSGTRPFDLVSDFVYSSFALRLEASVKLPNYLVRRE